MNDKGVCRTALVTLGLLIKKNIVNEQDHFIVKDPPLVYSTPLQNPPRTLLLASQLFRL